MPLSWDAIQANAVKFSARWQDAHSEEAEGQAFTLDFFRVFGLDDPASTGAFEHKVPLDDGRTGYIDYLWKKRIAIEMKSLGKDLNKAYAQLKEYVFHLPDDEMPDLLMVCDFATMVLHSRTTGKKVSFKTRELRKHIKRFADIAGYETTRVYESQVEVNVQAAEKMAQLHDALKTHGYEGHNLEVYLVRLLFCMFAENTGIFPQDAFLNYVENSRENGSDLSERIGRLFEVLNMPDATRAKRTLLSADLKRFRYINGGLFDDLLPSADFDANMRRILIDCCKFDWSKISPAIFGAMFQGVMDKGKRRELGAHYTSEENILKLINPLFMDDLWREFEQVKINPVQLDLFHDKIGRLHFLDPACGCGNFLLVAYRELRLLELEILKMKVNTGQKFLDLSPLLKVGVEQFYGIELEDFPCQIAQAGMWLMDHMMNLRAADQFGLYFARLPLTASAHIVHGNALRMDWETVVPKEELSYILGNPPFAGARMMSETQKKDMGLVFGELHGLGNLDYVTAWYKKAAGMMAGTEIQTAFVSTNSVSQGEQVAIVWKHLLHEYDIKIGFAYRTFKWGNEARGKAAVHCVIIGLSKEQDRQKVIYDSDDAQIIAKNINGYLVDAANVFIESRSKPLCGVPEIGIGNQPIDCGNYLFNEEEKAAFLRKEPQAKKWFRPWLGSDEFINGYRRWCLWLGACSPSELRQMPESMRRVDAVRLFRLSSKRAQTRKLAETPRNFQTENMPASNYIVVPEVSSERRAYIPIGFMGPDVLCSNLVKIIPNATLYHFGILTSSVHNAWTRAVCGRLKSDYRYSKDIVYNNFPWPEAADEQKTVIEKLAQAVLDARELFPNSSLADLYDPLTMPAELLKTHKALDAAVIKLYGYPANMTEASYVAALMERYQELVAKQ
ncbi:MAG: class I SAM-dependent DNA methyltransferase [Proteobacteria bacterium]|nr:class I SAM-dependent DNA methyltransferase [Pseudomonadota bacterium]